MPCRSVQQGANHAECASFRVRFVANPSPYYPPLSRATQESGGQKVRLSGYGVELAIKSTEYKAQDDTKVQQESSGDAAAQDQPDDVEGFLFNKLR